VSDNQLFVYFSFFFLGELKSNFQITRPRYILTRPEETSVIQEAISDFDPKPEIIILDDENFKEILKKGFHADPETFETAPIEDASSHVFAYMFPSGTSGKQKAVEQKGYNFVRSALISA